MRPHKVIFIIMIALMIVPINTIHADDPYEPDFPRPPGALDVYKFNYYWEFKDEYRVDFENPPVQWDTLRMRYETFWGVEYITDYDYSTNMMWLTCNGYYWIIFLNNGEVVAQSDMMKTTLILNPACQSYPEEGGNKDFDARYNSDGNGGYNLDWDDLPGAAGYDVYVDGQHAGSTSGNDFNMDGPGAVSIVARDEQGNAIGQTDLHVPSMGGGNGGGNGGGGGCSACDMIQDALACPHWGDYMGSITDAVRDAWPTPAEWHNISNIFANNFINAFDNYLGDMPTAPSTNDIYNQINEPLPDIDTSWPDADNLIPDMPSEYDQPWDFDITSGDQIQVIDESEPIDIDEPLHDMDYDDPGIMVIPGDPSNNTGGIKIPDSIELPMPEPSPSYDDPIPPGNDPPVPNYPGGPGPMPNYPGGVGPVPNW